MTAEAQGDEMAAALARLRNELNHYVFCPSPDLACTCQHFADLALATAELKRLQVLLEIANASQD